MPTSCARAEPVRAVVSMGQAEFDRHATSYRSQHEKSIAITGEEPAYFADYKMRDFRSLVVEAGLPLNGRYLDFGSGVGSSVRPFLERLPDAQLMCADVSAESLALSRGVHGCAVEYMWMQDGGLPCGSGQFDGAFACCVFHHIPPAEHQRSLTEIRRVLRPGGLLMVYEHNPFNPLTVRAVRNCPFDENAILITAREMKRRAECAGFTAIRCDYRVYFPAVLAGLRFLETSLRRVPLGAQYFLAMRA